MLNFSTVLEYEALDQSTEDPSEARAWLNPCLDMGHVMKLEACIEAR